MIGMDSKSATKALPKEGICAVCEKPIPPDPNGKPKTIENGSVHRDCWYEELGKEVEEHPLGYARIRR